MSDIIINPYIFVGGPISSYDPDAQNYISRVELADGASLETAVKDAMNQLVLDLKANSLWTPQVYTLPGSGPRTLAGGLVPLQDTGASGSFGTVNWDRKTGFSCSANTTAVTLPASLTEQTVGSQDDVSMSAWITQASGVNTYYCGSNYVEFRRATTRNAQFRCRSATGNSTGTNSDGTGFRGISRSGSTNYTRRINGSSTTVTQASSAPLAVSFRLFRSPPPSARNPLQAPVDTKIAWFQIGTNIDLATLQTVVTTYRNTINAAI
jgi:hypothetical protein